ncbi:hypothetical protein GCM10023160_00490 [Brachybacterium paraconglomeratum]|uniref:PRC-barrel domain-containing protein n=1 Tax=Brachybacterium paraconglomeratum TaxID=173362 RepID=UPI0031F0FB11
MRESLSAAKGDTAALVPGGPPQEQSAPGGQEPSLRAERRRRLQGLAGLSVLGSDGKTVGRVRDIYQQDDSGELAAITVMPRQLSSRSVLIPAAAIAALPAEQPADGTATDTATGRTDATGTTGADAPALGAGTADAAATATAPDAIDAADSESSEAKPPDVVRLRLDAATARSGLRPPDTGHASPQMLREAAEALGLATAAESTAESAAADDADAGSDADASAAPADAAPADAAADAAPVAADRAPGIRETAVDDA